MPKFIAKASDAVLSHCRCTRTFASVPMQAECPWCGCGWLLVCTTCRKGFVYGTVVEAELDHETFVRADLERRGAKETSRDEVRETVEWLDEALRDVPAGETIVYLDGTYLPLHEPGPFVLEGLYARHELDRVPHLVALSDPTHLPRTLRQREYWDARRLREGE